jgi:hypothetical protein
MLDVPVLVVPDAVADLVVVGTVGVDRMVDSLVLAVPGVGQIV